MHVVALNQYFPPHPSATSQLLGELAQGLAERAHEVTVITSAVNGAAAATPSGVNVVHVRGTTLGKGRLAYRAADYGSFLVGAGLAAQKLRRVDVFLPMTTPPFIALPAQLAARRRTAVVTLVQDLYPDIAVQLGVIARDSWMHRAWAQVTRASLRASTRVIALSEAMAERIMVYGVPSDRIDRIPNWALREVAAHPPSADAERLAQRAAYGIGARFAVMYSGNLGAGHQFETLLAAARQLRGREDIVFIFVGDGMRRAEVERFVATERLSNVKFFPLAPLPRLAASLAAADLHVITLRNGFEGLLVPSKLYGIMAASRPAMFIGPAHDAVAATLHEAGAGLSFEHGDVSAVVDAIVGLAAEPGRGVAMGEAGRRYAAEQLGCERAVRAYEVALERAVQTARRGAAG